MEYVAALIYWIRGFGDNPALAVFTAEVWRKFELDNEDGYYPTSVRDVSKRTNAVTVASGVSIYVASAIEMEELQSAVLAQPFCHSVIDRAVADRAIWMDGFAYFSVPFLIVAIWQVVRCRRWELALRFVPTFSV